MAVLFILAASNVVAFPSSSSSCEIGSSCHNSTDNVSITSNATIIDTETGAIFYLDITASGTAQDFIVKAPANVEDNNAFGFGTLDEGLVNDNDPVDLDATALQIHVIYEVTAPAFADTYTLRIYAAQPTPNSNFVDITVTTVSTAPGPAVTDVNINPAAPIAGQALTVSASVTSTDGISQVILMYTNNNRTTWNNVTMEASDSIYTGAIPAQAHNTYLIFKIAATDGNGVESVSGEVIFRLLAPPPPQLHYGFWLGALEYYDEERFTRVHGIMLSAAYILTTINVLALFTSDPAGWTALNPIYLFDMSNILLFVHSWHIWLGFVSMIFGTLAFLTHIAGWKTCNLGLPAVLLWTILAIMGVYLGETFVM
ncbi:MAG: hypothetical protein ACXABZ_12970 [Candidatus Thorarchaeota archaeon]